VNLYEITSELAIVEDWIREAGGEVDDTLEEMLDEAKLPFVAKIENIGKFSLNLKAKAKALKEEEARLSRRRKVLENTEKRIIKWAKENMDRVGTTRVEFTTFNAVIKKNPASVEIVDEDKIPAIYKTIIPESYVVDKKSLLKALKINEAKRLQLLKEAANKDGAVALDESLQILKETTINGVKLITDKTRLEIK